jgi:hypothetical protein
MSGLSPEVSRYLPQEAVRFYPASDPPKTLDQLQGHYRFLYGKRYGIYLDGRSTKRDFVNLALNDFSDGVRKRASRKDKSRLLSRVMSRTFVVADGMNGLSVAQALSEKYPLEGCAYCQHIPCTCEERRSDPVAAQVNAKQMSWSLKDWQSHLNALYGANNKRRRINYIINRVGREISEIDSLDIRITHNTLRALQLDLGGIEKEYAHEVADLAAWTMAAGNYYGMDLQTTLLENYHPHCWSCEQNPCQCGHINWDPVATPIVIKRVRGKVSA